MATLSLEHVRPGMVLIQDILGPGGRLLLAAGTPVTSQHLELLGKRGVTHLEVAEPRPVSMKSYWSAAQQANYAEFFRLHGDHPVSLELKRLFRLRNGDPDQS